ncbi:6-phosphofructokinase [Natronospora cellulosivora (SeqCode)]
MNKIAVLTSGGDAPGMNAAIRAVVRTAIYNKLEVLGVSRGYAGLIEGDFIEMQSNTVSDIMQKGGTYLLSARCEEFRTPEGRKTAYEQLKKAGVDALVVIGGDGSLSGANSLYKECNVPFVGVPGTIDNDLAGTDYTIGFDTAMNTIVDAINKVRDTATSHERTFVIETMGRTTGFLTVMAGLAGGADILLIPEENTDIHDICDKLKERHNKGRLHNLLLVAEGYGGDFKTNRDINESKAFSIARTINEKTGQETRVIILGHLQRGGSPTVMDRILASRLGARAVELLIEGQYCKMVGLKGNKIVHNNIEDIINKKKEIDIELYKLNKILSI